MENKEINLKDRETAFAALAYLFAGAIQADLEHQKIKSVSFYDVRITRNIGLSGQAKRSLAKLIEDADGFELSQNGGVIRLRFLLESAE